MITAIGDPGKEHGAWCKEQGDIQNPYERFSALNILSLLVVSMRRHEVSLCFMK